MPCLLALPQVLVVFLRARGQCGPYELDKKVEEFINVGAEAVGMVQ